MWSKTRGPGGRARRRAVGRSSVAPGGGAVGWGGGEGSQAALGRSEAVGGDDAQSFESSEYTRGTAKYPSGPVKKLTSSVCRSFSLTPSLANEWVTARAQRYLNGSRSISSAENDTPSIAQCAVTMDVT